MKKKSVKFIIFASIPAIIVFGLFSLYFFLIHQKVEIAKAKKLHQEAWEATFTECGETIPSNGPREGYWGTKIYPKIKHEILGWREPSRHRPGFLEIDSQGFQRYSSGENEQRFRILILGGSVAFGGCSSSIEKTYFHLLGEKLKENGTPVEILILAAGAWKSEQDLKALKLYYGSIKPDLVIFFNGLNDLTNGPEASLRYGHKVETKDGSEWTSLYHSHDYEDRVKLYLENMVAAAGSVDSDKTGLIFALQPSLSEKSDLTPIERKLLQSSIVHHLPGALKNGYSEIRNGLKKISEKDNVYFIDCSILLNDIKTTSYIDLWHFTDKGHEMVAEIMNQKIEEILKNRDN